MLSVTHPHAMGCGLGDTKPSLPGGRELEEACPRQAGFALR